MIIVDFKQGSEAWLNYRRDCYNASDAPAMMGVSPYKTRQKLIEEIILGAKKHSEETENLFKRGHEAEGLARASAEIIVGRPLKPLVGRDGKMHSASFDGITEDYLMIWEHKMLNNRIRSADSIDDLHKMYKIQMEQQLYISGAENCLFTATKWLGSELLESREFIYYPDVKLRKEILSGWEQLREEVSIILRRDHGFDI